MTKLHHPNPGLLVLRRRKQTMVALAQDRMTIGRKQADILIDDPGVSSTHAEIQRSGQKILLIDLKSTNGTFVNRKAITECELVDQDLIEIGATTLCFYADLREFRGQAENFLAPHVKPEPDPERDVVSTSRTLSLPHCHIAITLGPDSGKKFSFRKSHILIGRKDADLVLMDVDISRAHAMIEVLSPKNIYVRDLNSTNGTFVNGQQVQSTKLNSGDEVSVGNSKLIITFEEAA